jgi:hypothetical protein
MNIEPQTIRDIIWEKEKKWIDFPEARKISNRLATKYIFPEDAEELLFYIREPIVQNEEEAKKNFRGYGKKLKVQSAMGSSVVMIDGMISQKIKFGSSFTAERSDKPLYSIHLTF